MSDCASASTVKRINLLSRIKRENSPNQNVTSSNEPEPLKKIHEKLGRRTCLHNVFHLNDGVKVWNIMSRVCFDKIKMWKNEFGQIRCKATGKISVKGSPGRSFIEINTAVNLRKFLDLSHTQWSALCELVAEKNIILSFNAYEFVDLSKMCFLSRLWLFLCSRRHFQSNICVIGKLAGAAKLMKEFEIIPRIVVLEIRDFNGNKID